MISNMINFIFPIRLGEILKLYIINKVSGITYPTSISATLSDRFSHLLCILIFLLFTPMAGFELSQWSSRFVLFFVIFLILSVCLFIFGTRLLDVVAKWLRGLLLLLQVDQDRIEDLSEGRLISFCRETLEKIKISGFSKGNLLVIASSSFVIVSLEGICYYFIIRAFGVHITWLQGALAACFMNLMFILPTPPAQVGTAEMYPVLIFSFGLDLSYSIVSSVAILWHVLTSIIFVLLGFCSAVSLGVGLGTIFLKIREFQEGSVEEREEYQGKI